MAADETGTSVEQMLAELDIPRFEDEELEGAAIVDAIVILRYQRPDWDLPKLTYVQSRRMGDELSIGCVSNVLDHMKASVLENWT